jgi:hypothetical protein
MKPVPMWARYPAIDKVNLIQFYVKFVIDFRYVSNFLRGLRLLRPKK